MGCYHSDIIDMDLFKASASEVYLCCYDKLEIGHHHFVSLCEVTWMELYVEGFTDSPSFVHLTHSCQEPNTLFKK